MCKVKMQVKRRRIDKVDRAVHYVIFLGPTGSLAFTLLVIGMGKSPFWHIYEVLPLSTYKHFKYSKYLSDSFLCKSTKAIT